MDQNERIKSIEHQASEVEAKRHAQKAFMEEARSHEDDLFSWLANQELNGHYPGKEMGLTVIFDGQICFFQTID